MKFCFLCGKKTENLVNGYCEECYKKKFQLIQVPEEFVITVCSKCNRIKEKNKWKEIEIEDVLRDKIKIIGKNVKIRIESNEDVKIFAKGLLEGSKYLKEEVHEVKLKIIKQVCSECSRKFGRYYEAIVQVRGSLTNDDIDVIDDAVLAKGCFYRLEEVKGGYDFFLSSKSLAEKITEILRKRYKAEIKKSYQLVTRKEGKDIYRDTILVRIMSD